MISRPNIVEIQDWTEKTRLAAQVDEKIDDIKHNVMPYHIRRRAKKKRNVMDLIGIKCQGLRDPYGEILIEDTSAELLSRDIGVKRIHINQVLR